MTNPEDWRDPPEPEPAQAVWKRGQKALPPVRDARPQRSDPTYGELREVSKRLHVMLGAMLVRVLNTGHVRYCPDCIEAVDQAFAALADSHRLHPDWLIDERLLQEVTRRAASS